MSLLVGERNNYATKIQSKFRGYNTRKLTNTIKENSRKFLQGLSKKQERRNKVFKILKRMFDKTHQASHSRAYDASDEVKLIMSNLGQIEHVQPRQNKIEQLKLIKQLDKIDQEDIDKYEKKILSLVKTMRDKLDGFSGNTEQSRAKVHKELEELRYLFYIPYNKAWGWSYSDQKYKIPYQTLIDDADIEGTKFALFWYNRGPDMVEYIQRELPSLFPEHRPGSYMMRAGGKKNTYKRKFYKTSF